MKKVLIIGAVIVLVLGVAAGGYFLFFNGEESTTTNTSSQTENTASTNEFSLALTQNVPMVATISTTQDGEKNTFVMSFDGKGNSEYEVEQNGEQVRFISTKTDYYMCNTQGCFKYANTQEQTGTSNPDEYEYDQTEIDAFKANSTYKGQQSCGSGTCDVWEVANFSGGGTATLYIDSTSKRIMKIESAFNGSTTTITYDYKDVTIEVPADAQELPSGI